MRYCLPHQNASARGQGPGLPGAGSARPRWCRTQAGPQSVTGWMPSDSHRGCRVSVEPSFCFLVFVCNVYWGIVDLKCGILIYSKVNQLYVHICAYIKKAEHRRIDAFELWCWRRLLRVPWTARRSNQSILKEISPKYSLEGLMLKLKLQ